MSERYSILPPGPTTLTIADKDTFIRAARAQWPRCRIVQAGLSPEDSDADAYPVFEGHEVEICHFPENKVISCSGPFNQPGVAEVAAWVRSLNPDPNLVLWLTDTFFTGHVVLAPGITADEIRASWVDHAEHDPTVEYPEYFGN
ncbi:hypothetical protein [Actinomyces procaprae]|uniref:hypothetical protein n=1 Tax=Actinomyces procaprae TaxID=2560010 RepID=UPI0010A273C6|nr:hypothetical protein [Actinomyces procaprae]